MVNDYYFMPNAYLSFWSGSGIATDQMHGGATMGATGDMVADICMRVSFKNQVKERTRLKKSGFAGYRTTEGMLKPAEFSMTLKTNSMVPLSWVHSSDSDTATPKVHLLYIPSVQQPHVSATATTAIPALAFRIERESATNANQRVDLLGCVITKLVLTVEDGGMAQWEVTGLCEMVLAGVAHITSQVADPTLPVYGWQHQAITHAITCAAISISNKSLAFTHKTITVTWELEWEPIAPTTKVTGYFVYTNWLLKKWDVAFELNGLPYEDATLCSVFALARQPVNIATTGAVNYTYAFTLVLTRTASTDLVSYAFDKVEMSLENDADEDRESSGYREVPITLVPAEGATLTATSTDALTAAYYGGAT